MGVYNAILVSATEFLSDIGAYINIYIYVFGVELGAPNMKNPDYTLNSQSSELLYPKYMFNPNLLLNPTPVNPKPLTTKPLNPEF